MTKDQKKTLKFIKEIDIFKEVFRKTHIKDAKRLENNAEHTWHLCMLVWLFAKDYEQNIDLEKALKLALTHDLIEIYAGDTFSFDHEGRKTKVKREKAAAKKLFNKLPLDLKTELSLAWQEYEDKKTQEAKYVQALDKIHPTIQNIISGGRSWTENNVTEKMIRDYKSSYNEGSPFLISLFDSILKEGRRKKILKKG